MARTTWTDAFTVLEEELATVLALARAYDAHLEEVANKAAQRIRAAVSADYEISVCTDDEAVPGQWGIKVELGGEIADAQLDVRTWAAAPYEGPPGQMRACLYLSDGAVEGMPSLEERLEVVRAVVGRVAKDRLDVDVLATDDPPIALRSLDISRADLDEALAEAVVELIGIAERVAEPLLELRTLTPYVLLLDALRRVRLEGVLERSCGGSVKPNKWDGGHDLIVNARNAPQSWITAFPSGELTLHWGPKKDQSDEKRDQVAAATGGSPDNRLGYLGVKLMDSAAVQALIDDNDTGDARDAVVNRIVSAWEQWREVM